MLFHVTELKMSIHCHHSYTGKISKLIREAEKKTDYTADEFFFSESPHTKNKHSATHHKPPAQPDVSFVK